MTLQQKFFWPYRPTFLSQVFNQATLPAFCWLFFCSFLLIILFQLWLIILFQPWLIILFQPFLGDFLGFFFHSFIGGRHDHIKNRRQLYNNWSEEANAQQLIQRRIVEPKMDNQLYNQKFGLYTHWTKWPKTQNFGPKLTKTPKKAVYPKPKTQNRLGAEKGPNP